MPGLFPACWPRTSQIENRPIKILDIYRIDGGFSCGYTHRRRIKTEVKAKVVAAVWGARLINNFFATLAILHQDYLNNRMN